MSKSQPTNDIIKKAKTVGRNTYTTIGEYIFTFEGMLGAIREVIKNCACKEGLFNENIVKILIYDSTSAPLLAYFKALIFEIYPEQMQDEKIRKFMKDIWKDVEEAYKVRNEIAHSHYYYGFYESNKTDKSKESLTPFIITERNKIYADGFKLNQDPLNLKEIQRLSKKVSKLKREIEHIAINIPTYNKRLDAPFRMNLKIPKNDFFRNAEAEKKEERRKRWSKGIYTDEDFD